MVSLRMISPGLILVCGPVQDSKQEGNTVGGGDARHQFLPGLKFWRNRQRFGESISPYKPVGLFYSFTLRERQTDNKTPSFLCVRP